MTVKSYFARQRTELGVSQLQKLEKATSRDLKFKKDKGRQTPNRSYRVPLKDALVTKHQLVVWQTTLSSTNRGVQNCSSSRRTSAAGDVTKGPVNLFALLLLAMKLFALLLLAMNIIASNASPNNTRYPQDALQCYTSSALSSQKDGAIICPQDRQAFCIKEVINSSRRECGSVEGIYYGRDVWDRKVSAVRYDWTEPCRIYFHSHIPSPSSHNASTENVQQHAHQ